MLVTDHLDDALPPGVRAEVERHLAECPHCAEYLEEIRRTVAALGHMPVASLSPQTREGILKAFLRGYRAG